MKISIPKPCHEDWNKMLPEEQGRFCLSCAKTVVDFSAKSRDEIKSFFREATGRVCGRFSLNQLDQSKVAYAYPPKRLGKFVCALYFVFGAFLFSCSGKEEIIKVGEVQPDPQEYTEPRVDGQLQGEPMITKPDPDKAVKAKKNKKAKKKSCVKPAVVDSSSIYQIKGDVMIDGMVAIDEEDE